MFSGLTRIVLCSGALFSFNLMRCLSSPISTIHPSFALYSSFFKPTNYTSAPFFFIGTAEWNWMCESICLNLRSFLRNERDHAKRVCLLRSRICLGRTGGGQEASEFTPLCPTALCAVARLFRRDSTTRRETRHETRYKHQRQKLGRVRHPVKQWKNSASSKLLGIQWITDL
jgi:hypothetical protein